MADDGVPLHVEVDEFDRPRGAGDGAPGKTADAPPLTVVFVHGYALNLDCWHFQRAGYRGLVRAVYYDQRSHGRSGRSTDGHATIEQLGHDLKQVLDEVVPDGPVVLVGHSMGGMTIVALAEQLPELFGDRVVGVGLISTTAGGLDPSRIVLPMLPLSIGGGLTHRAVRLLAPRTPGDRRAAPDGAGLRDGGHRPVRVRRRGPQAYVEFVDKMLAATPFEVVAEFFRGSAASTSSTPSRCPAGADRDHLRHRRPDHLDRTQPQAARAASPARRCWSARAPDTW